MADDVLNLADLDADLGVPGDGDPLVTLGLLDPKTGQALATDDWHPEGDRAPAPSSGQDWESDQNPYKQQLRQMEPDAGLAARQHLDQKRAAIESEATAAQAVLMANGMHQDVAAAVVQSLKTAALTQAQAEAERIALFPTVREKVAGDIARDYSLPGIEIKAEDFRGLATVAEMESRAKQLQRERQDARYQGRVARKADRAEGGPSAGASTIDYSTLEPQQVIRLGIARTGGV